MNIKIWNKKRVKKGGKSGSPLTVFFLPKEMEKSLRASHAIFKLANQTSSKLSAFRDITTAHFSSPLRPQVFPTVGCALLCVFGHLINSERSIYRGRTRQLLPQQNWRPVINWPHTKPLPDSQETIKGASDLSPNAHLSFVLTSVMHPLCRNASLILIALGPWQR